VEAVLFDLDDTVLDRQGSLLDFLQWQLKGLLRTETIDPVAFSDRFMALDDGGKLWKEAVYRQLIEEFSIEHWRVEELLASYELCFCGFCRPKNGVVAAIEQLVASGLKCAIVSNGKSPFQQRNLAALGIAHLFEAVIVSSAVGLRKPDPAIFKLCCDRLTVAPEQAVFVGDNPLADIAGAARAGLVTVYIPGRFGSHCEEAGAVCDDFAKLATIVMQLTSSHPEISSC